MSEASKSEASRRVLAWREQKRADGFQPVTIWIPATIKNSMVNLAFQQHQDLGELLTAAFQAWTPAKGARPSTVVDMRRVEALVDQKIAHALTSQHQAPTPPPPERPPLPAGLKRCPKGHQYPAGSKECPQCRTLSKRAQRKREKEKRQGEIPVPS
jgi:hypothetical protein